MRHQNKIAKLGLNTAHRNLMLRNLATSIIIYEKVKTTFAKANAVAPIVEGLITTAKGADQVTAIREINKIVLDVNASKKLMQELNKRYADRKGGCTRVTGLGYRMGDGAKLAQIELI